MKIKMSIVYLVLLVLGFIAAGVLTGIYGNDIGIWVSYSFIGVYGMMIIANAIVIEKVSSIKIESSEVSNELTPEQIKSLPSKLGEGEEKKVGETMLEENHIEEIKKEELEARENREKAQLDEKQKKTLMDMAKYVKENVEKGHPVEKVREAMIKGGYTEEAVDFVISKVVVAKEPELPDLGEPEEVTVETLDEDIKKKSKEEFKCEPCGKTFKKAHLLKNHMRLSKKCQS